MKQAAIILFFLGALCALFCSSCASLAPYLRAGAVTAATMADAIEVAQQQTMAALEPRIEAADELPEVDLEALMKMLVTLGVGIPASTYATNKVRDRRRRKRGEKT